MTDIPRAKELANAYAESKGTDVLLYSGPMDFAFDQALHDRLDRRKHPRLLLVLTTTGGDAHVAYRAARVLQRVYEHVSVLVSGWCKSAGTLLAVGGHDLIVADRGELGPIDVQRGRTDDLWESTSGLTETAAVTTLEEIAWSLFRKLVTETKALSIGQITFKTAADAAAPLVSGMLTPIFAQIDPLKLGENARLLRIASEYARRLNERADNLVPDRPSAEALISGYPDHGFVIDRTEAETLFRRVREPCAELRELTDALGEVALYPNDEHPMLSFLNEERPAETSNDEADEEITNGAQEKPIAVDGEAESEHASADPPSDATVAPSPAEGA